MRDEWQTTTITEDRATQPMEDGGWVSQLLQSYHHDIFRANVQFCNNTLLFSSVWSSLLTHLCFVFDTFRARLSVPIFCSENCLKQLLFAQIAKITIIIIIIIIIVKRNYYLHRLQKVPLHRNSPLSPPLAAKHNLSGLSFFSSFSLHLYYQLMVMMTTFKESYDDDDDFQPRGFNHNNSGGFGEWTRAWGWHRGL